MELIAMDDAIERMEEIEEDVLTLVEIDPQLIRSADMLESLKHLKRSIDALKNVRAALGAPPSPVSQPMPESQASLQLRRH